MALGPSHDFNRNRPQAERDLRQREIINLERHSTSDDLDTDNADTMTKVEGFHISTDVVLPLSIDPAYRCIKELENI